MDNKEGLRKQSSISLEAAAALAKKYGYRSYGDFTQDLFRHKTTIDQFVKNGERFNEPKPERRELLRQDVALH